MEFQRSRLEHPESQESEGHSYLLSFRTSLPEMTLRGPPLRGVDSSFLSCVASANFSLRSKCRQPQPCNGRIAVFLAISSTVRRNTAPRVPCSPHCKTCASRYSRRI